MSPIQQMLLGAGGAVATKTYVDDIFSTFLYEGTGSTQSINNGINLSGEGGLIWTKYRNESWHNALIDSERGIDSVLTSNNSDAANIINTSPGSMVSFNNNGYTLASDSAGWVNSNEKELVSWTFRKAPGFFTCLKFTGNGTAGRTLSHSLGSVPGLVLIKQTNSTQDWVVYHRSLDTNKKLKLNGDTAEASTSSWNSTRPTSTTITLGAATGVNGANHEFVAYVFAGGESTNANAHSVDLSVNSNSSLTMPDSTDFDFGSGDLTMECWVKFDQTETGVLIGQSASSLQWSDGTSLIFYMDAGEVKIFARNSTNTGWIFAGGTASIGTPPVGQWTHLAVTRSSNVFRFFLNGTQTYTATKTEAIQNVGGNFGVCYNGALGGASNCQVSNLRIVKGTAVYTSSFIPSTAPLTNVTNTVLLCCNSSTATGSTVSPGTIWANYGATAITDSPFDDPAGFSFGENEDQNVIKCGSYKASTVDFEVNLGWEPQWIMFKRTDSSANWSLFDSMRGIVTGGNENYLYPNLNNAEYTAERISLTPTGFIVDASAGVLINGSNGEYIYVAIRSATGTVTRPALLGTDVFAMDTGTGAGALPNFDSGFPVDFQILRQPASTSDWLAGARKLGLNYLITNSANSQATASSGPWRWDSNEGWNAHSGYDSSYQSWMWKRHAGFDCIAYKGDGVSGRQISHSLNKTVEMVWIKDRDASRNWYVGHVGLNGGTNPWEYYIELNNDDTEYNDTSTWTSSPTSTVFTLGNQGEVNANAHNYIAMLFSSTAVSKVGYYDGSNSAQTITTGFQPRFVIIKRISAADSWYVFDSVRGWGSGTDNALALDSNAAATTNLDYGSFESTGFSLIGDTPRVNGAGNNYIYYCHA